MSVYHKKIGEYEITVSSPSPMWTTISRGHQKIGGINEEDLEDLYYVLRQALSRVKARQKR